jgi:hypothetical protein
LLSAAIAITATASVAMAREPKPSIKPSKQAPVVAIPDRGPMLTVVSIRKQRLRIFDLNGEVASSRVSSGRPGFDTPTGVFAILEKNVHHQSNIYAGAQMPFMQRLTWSGIALHAGVVPGYRASHGCIRLPYSFARSLFGITNMGGRVVVTMDETQPIPFSHPKLFKPLPESQPIVVARKSNVTQVASNNLIVDDASRDELPDFSRFFGITPALAEAVADYRDGPQRPRTRLEAEQAAREKIATAELSLKAIEDLRRQSTDTAKQSVDTAQQAQAKLAKLKSEGDKLKAAVKAAEAKQLDAQKSFDEFHTSTAAMPLAEREDKEASLEDALLDTTLAADTARVAVARHELSMADLQTTAVTSDSARQRALQSVQKSAADLKAAQTAVTAAKKEVQRRNKPVSVFVSLKTERVYVRQGFEAVLDAPIQVANRGQRYGTQVMTAMRYDPRDPNVFEWRLVTANMPSLSSEQTSRKKRRDDARLPQSYGNGAMLAADALDNITLPKNVLDIISELAKPGSSIIISDRDLKPNENGLNTDFVVLTR